MPLPGSRRIRNLLLDQRQVGEDVSRSAMDDFVVDYLICSGWA